ncbi:membrane protein [Rhypophila sp. PSN 637]
MQSDETTPLILPTTSAARNPQAADSASSEHSTKSRSRKALSVIMSASTFWKAGAIYGAAAVGLGAFGAHGLKRRITDPAKIDNWKTAANYQLVHSVVLLMARENPAASVLFITGMTMFSGSIYALTLDTERFRWMGPVTPLGGLCLIAGWLAMAFTKGRVRF